MKKTKINMQDIIEKQSTQVPKLNSKKSINWNELETNFNIECVTRDTIVKSPADLFEWFKAEINEYSNY